MITKFKDFWEYRYISREMVTDSLNDINYERLPYSEPQHILHLLLIANLQNKCQNRTFHNRVQNSGHNCS